MTRPLLVLFVFCLLSGCGGGSDGGGATVNAPGGTTQPAPDPTGLWITSEPGEGFAAYRDKLSGVSPERSLVAFDAAPSALSTEGTGGGFSTTYTVDDTVDEHDIVKYNGTVLAVAPSRNACCFIWKMLDG